ncbi:MAG: LysR family transcriptional regulator [Aestuariibacter sp.]
MINPGWLKSFCTLVETGHFTKTAEKLHMTQSGVSQHVKKLEDYMDGVLLERQGKQFTVTPAGENLYLEGRRILLALSDLDRKQSTKVACRGTVKLMSPGSIGLALYPHLLELQAENPELVIDFRFAPNNDIEIAIATNHIDIGIMTNVPADKQLSFRAIGQEPLLLVTPTSVSNPDWETLNELGFIDHPDGGLHATKLLSANFQQFRHIHQFRKRGFSNQISMILQPVSLGLGFTVLPQFAVSHFQQQQSITAHQLLNPVHEVLYSVMHDIELAAPGAETVLNTITTFLQSTAHSAVR